MTALYGGVETGGTWCVCALASTPAEPELGLRASGPAEPDLGLRASRPAGPDLEPRTATPPRIIAREQFPTTTPDEAIARMVAFFERHPRPRAIGVGAFGPVNVDPASDSWGLVTTTPKPGWQDVALAPILRERLGIPIAFDTDVGAAAVAEQLWGAGHGRPSVCYLTVGTGIGAGLAIDGRPWHGLVHPEVGHMRIPHDRERDPFPGICTSHGDCWEGLACGPAIAARAGRPAQELSGGDPIWELVAEYLALGLLTIVAVASPHLIVIGGGVLEQPALLPLVRARLREFNDGYLRTPLLAERIDEYLVSPQLGDDAGVLGAVALARTLA